MVEEDEPITQERIALTMRDVKELPPNKCELREVYCLNYAGCKVQ